MDVRIDLLEQQVKSSLESKVMLDRLEDFVIRELQKLRDENTRQSLAL